MCRELEAFVFVFEAANRIVLEKPKYSHATYFFEIEEPLPISCQVTFWFQVLALSGNSFWHQRRKLSVLSSPHTCTACQKAIDTVEALLAPVGIGRVPGAARKPSSCSSMLHRIVLHAPCRCKSCM